MKLPVQYDKIPPKEKWKVREAYIEEQSGFCYYCKSPLKWAPPIDILSKKVTPSLYPFGFFNHPVHLHHSHDTGLTLGAVHCHCNAVLWEYENE